MAKTSIHSTNGKITGKTVRDGNRTTHYKNTGSDWLGPNYKATSTTVKDRNGNTRTKKY